MPLQLAHAPSCRQVPWEHPKLALTCTIMPHPTRSGATNVTWTEQCVDCGRILNYSTEVVAYRNIIKNIRLNAVISIATWLQRQGLWGDQPLAGRS